MSPETHDRDATLILCSALGGIKFLGLIQQYYSLVFRQTEAHHWPVRHGFWNMRKKIAADNIKLKRAYEPAEEEDGQRILVDRLWPRGLSKADSKIDEWIKAIAPSTTLRKWFGHEVASREAFHDSYIEEVSESTEPLERQREMAGKGRITLVYTM